MFWKTYTEVSVLLKNDVNAITPNIDNLAKNGIIYKNAHSQVRFIRK